MSQAPAFISRTVTMVALAGWLPFIAGFVLTLVPWLSPIDMVIVERAIIGYGALILSFLGGVRWGIRLQGGAGSDLIFVIGILGSGLGLATMLLPYSLAIAVLTVGFGAQGAWDVWAGWRGGVPEFYARMRSLLTWLVCLTLLATLLARGFVGN